MFSWASGGIRSCWLKVAKATSEKRRLRWVVLGIRMYPGISVFQGFFCGQITCKSQCHQSYFRVSIPMVFVGIRGYPFCMWSNSLQITGCPCFRVSMSVCFRGYLGVSVPAGLRLQKLLPKSGGCVGFSWVSGGISFFCGPITFQSQCVILLSCLNFIGFRGYPGVPIITHFACGQVPCKSQGVLALGFQCPYVFVGIWGYPFLLV